MSSCLRAYHRKRTSLPDSAWYCFRSHIRHHHGVHALVYLVGSQSKWPFGWHEGTNLDLEESSVIACSMVEDASVDRLMVLSLGKEVGEGKEGRLQTEMLGNGRDGPSESPVLSRRKAL